MSLFRVYVDSAPITGTCAFDVDRAKGRRLYLVLCTDTVIRLFSAICSDDAFCVLDKHP